MNRASGDRLQGGSGRSWVLGELIKSGGAGSVFRLRDGTRQVAKLYHDSAELPVYERKVSAMLRLSPQLPDLEEKGRRFVQIAWPTELLRDSRGRFLGFVMPAVDIDATSELECILQERQARSLGLPTGLGAKVTLGANLAAVIAELHRQHHRVVDLKPVNLRFYPDALYMAMLDCDGFSIQGEGERFPAPQFTVDYLAPEFQAGGITVPGEEQQDRFALAVILFQLLNFGIHPFTGRPKSERVPTDVPGRIAGRFYAYGLDANPLLLPSPVSGHAAMPADLRQLFDRAFAGPALARPSAPEWAELLRNYAQRSSQRLVACTRDPAHQHFAGQACAACARQQLIEKTQRQQGDVGRAAVPAPPTRRPAPRGLRTPPPPVAPGRRKRATWPGTSPSTWTPPPLTPAPPAWLALAAGFTRLFGFRGWVLLIVGVFLLLDSGVRQLHEAWQPSVMEQAQFPEDTSASPDAEPEPADAPDPAPDAVDPATPLPSGPIVPIATSEGVPRSQWPDMASELQDTQRLVRGVTGGASSGNENVLNEGMRRLRRNVPARHGEAERMADTTRAFEFMTQVQATDVPERRLLLEGRARELRARPNDAETTCQWAWLALLLGEHQYAEDAFIRAIWADPDYRGGWAGLAFSAQDAVTAQGAMIMADRVGPLTKDERVRYADFARFMRERSISPAAP